MKNTTTALLDKNTIIFGTDTEVTTFITAIRTTVTSIGQKATTQPLNTTGATLTKKKLRTIAADKAEHVASGHQSYYKDL